MAPQTEVTEQVIRFCRRLSDRGMVAGSDGNLSVRLPGNKIICTPTRQPLGELTGEDLVTVDLDGTKTVGKHDPSSELAMHLFVYRHRADINACVHAHPPYATSFAVSGVPLPEDVLPEVVITVGPIAMTEYAAPGTDEVPESLKPFVTDHDTFLLRNHGLLTTGNTLEEAYYRHETVEHSAHIYSQAQLLGTPGRIPESDLNRLKGIRASTQEQRQGKRR